tara:strand:+ start:4005 stop:4421 length:417 start_codon:yes stop_codon:yes gene_type:complete
MSLNEEAEALRTHAQDEARRLGHMYVSTEHVLLAIARHATDRIRGALIKLEVETDELIEQIDASISGSGVQGGSQDIPFSPRATRVFERAVDVARGLGVESAEQEHVLLSLLEDEEGVAAQVLEEYGVDYASILNQLD